MNLISRLVCLAACTCAVSCASGGRPSVNVTTPEPATTGNKWVDDGVERADGSKCYVLADEECGGTTDADYLQYFEAPIFRSGYAMGTTAYAVDGTNIWVVDVSNPSTPQRLGIVAGVGRALAITGHGNRLYVAAAERGVAVFDVDPVDRSRLTRVEQLSLNGFPALDVAVSTDGKTGYAAAGAAGVFPLTLGATSTVGQAIAIDGFAAGVTLEGTFVYVAGCGGLDVIAAPTKQVVGHLKLSAGAGQAPRPAKDVAVSNHLAFVAAGRWGIVLVDVLDPTQPRLLGNRTVADDVLYYVNGVTVSHGAVYAAAGDWGVDRLTVDDVRRTNSALTEPTKFPTWCSAGENPDRKPAPEFATVLPPPRVRDPLDVVATGDALLSFGDASRIGLRAIDVYRLSNDQPHQSIGRYEEPRAVTAIASYGDRVAVSGSMSGFYRPSTGAAPLVRVSDVPSTHRSARALAFTSDGRLLGVDGAGALRLQGLAEPLALNVLPSLAVDGTRVVTAQERGGVTVLRVDINGSGVERKLTTAAFRYGAAQAVVGDRVFAASGDWTQVADFTLGDAHESTPEPVKLSGGLLTRTELDEPLNWRQGPPRRLLIRMGERLAEVVSFGAVAGAALHTPGAPVDVAPRFEVPGGVYVAGFGDAQRLWLVQGDRAHYRTIVHALDFGDFSGQPTVRSVSLVGNAVSAAMLNQRLYVADAEVGVRVFDLENGGLRLAGAVQGSGAP